MGALPSSSPARGTATGPSVAVAVVVAVAGLAITFLASGATGPGFDEEARLAAVHRATTLMRAVADYGPGAFGSSSGLAVYQDLSAVGAIPSLLSGWLGEVLATAHLLDGLTGARFGFLLITGLAPLAVFLVVEPSRGRRTAALSAALLVAMPRFLHGAAAAREPVIVTSLWLLVLAAYVHSLTPSIAERRLDTPRAHPRGATRASGTVMASVVFAAVLGFGVSVSLATLWVLPLVLAHHCWLRRRGLARELRRGRVPVPAALLFVLVISPPVLLLGSPHLFGGGAASAAAWLFAPLGLSNERLAYHRAVFSVRDIPGGFSAHFLAATVPAALLLLALGGAFVLARDARSGRSREDVRGLGALCLLATGTAVLGPLVTPSILAAFPARTEAALPFLAIAAAIAVEQGLVVALSDRYRTLAAIGCGLVAAAFGMTGIPTAAVSFNALSGGTRGAVESGFWAAADGSEVAPLARAIDALGFPSVNIQSSEAPRGYWAILVTTGRQRTRVDASRADVGARALVLSRGPRPGAFATVTRDGATLWSLSRKSATP